MPLSPNLNAIVASPRQEVVRQCSVTSYWQTLMTAGGPAHLDAAAITDPTTQIEDSTNRIFTLDNNFSGFALRMGYDDALTTITAPIVTVFGRTGADVWQLLLTQNLTETATLTVAASDVTDGTLKYTTPSLLLHAWDNFGCNQILVGVIQALAGTGVVSNSVMQIKGLSQ
jgi:hypothetical protein